MRSRVDDEVWSHGDVDVDRRCVRDVLQLLTRKAISGLTISLFLPFRGGYPGWFEKGDRCFGLDRKYLERRHDVTEHALDLIREKARELERDDAPTARRFYDVATGKVTFIRDLCTQWLSERTGQVRESVRGQQGAVLNGYLKWAGERAATVEETTRRKAVSTSHSCTERHQASRAAPHDVTHHRSRSFGGG